MTEPSAISKYLSLVKFSHTIFALPFAVIGFLIAIYTTDATFEASFDYGTAYEKIIYQGATNATDWLVTNLTTLATFTPDTVTENPDGTYVLDYSVSGSVVVGNSVKIEVTKIGFDGEGTGIAV